MPMKIGLRIFLGYFAIVALAALLLARVFVAEVKPGVRQAMEDTLVDSANVLAELANDELSDLRDRRARDRGVRQLGARRRQGFLALERRVPDAAGPLRRALHAQ